MNKPVIAVWFSCGAASAVAAKLTLETYGLDHTVRIINTPIAEEDADNRRFLEDCEKWIGQSIEIAVHSGYPNSSAVEVWRDKKAMSFPHGAPCTSILKRETRQQWESNNHHDYLVMGFTLEEISRHDTFVLTERTNVLPVLIKAGLTKQNCFEILRSAGVALPRAYHRGYPNANCIGCVKATSPTYWNHVRSADPEVFESRAKQSRELGARLVRVEGKRIFLDELDPSAKGRAMRSLKLGDCGIFCEEKATDS